MTGETHGSGTASQAASADAGLPQDNRIRCAELCACCGRSLHHRFRAKPDAPKSQCGPGDEFATFHGSPQGLKFGLTMKAERAVQLNDLRNRKLARHSAEWKLIAGHLSDFKWHNSEYSRLMKTRASGRGSLNASVRVRIPMMVMGDSDGIVMDVSEAS